MQPFSFFFVGYSLGGGGGGISGRVRALNLTVPLGSGQVGSDNLVYGPGSGFSFEPVQTSTIDTRLCNRGSNPAPASSHPVLQSFPALVTDPLVRLAVQSDGGEGSGVGR